MECPMCQELYDEKKLIPRNLPCGHTFCEYCLGQIIQVKGFIECPNCRKKLSPEIRPDTLSKNFIALDLALKQRQLSSKLQLCDKHQEFEQFFCEDCQEHLCTECIINHSGHKFVKQEHSVFLLKERLSKQKSQLNDVIETIHSSVLNAIEIKTYQEKYLNQQIELIDAEFDSLIQKINEKRNSFKAQYKEIYNEYIQSLELDIVLHQSISDQLFKSISTIESTEALLDQTKVIKNDQLVNKIEEIEDEIKKQIKESTISSEKQEFEIPSIVFGSEIFKYINNIAYLDSYQAKICYFGSKNKILIFDIKNQIWQKFNLPLKEKQQFLGYSSAVTLKNDNILVMGGGNTNQVFEISLQNDIKIVRRQKMPIARKEHCSVALNDGSVFVMGGYNMEDQQMLSSCYQYLPQTDEWKEKACMNIAKCAFAASLCSYGKYIYAFGGYDSHQRLNVIEKYTISTNSWEVIPIQIPKHISNCAALHHPRYASKDCIYILGGGHDEGFQREVYKFTTSPSYKIETIAEMENGKDLRNKVVMSKHYLYTIGGNGYKNERLNLITKVWDTLPSYYPQVVDNLDSWACALTYTNQSADDMLSQSLCLDKSFQINHHHQHHPQSQPNLNLNVQDNRFPPHYHQRRSQSNQMQQQLQQQQQQQQQIQLQHQYNYSLEQQNIPQSYGVRNIHFNDDNEDEELEENVSYEINEQDYRDQMNPQHNQREELRSSSNFYNSRFNFMLD